jgi:hypothetical protein
MRELDYWNVPIKLQAPNGTLRENTNSAIRAGKSPMIWLPNGNVH